MAKVFMSLLFVVVGPCLVLGQGLETIVPKIVKERAKVASYHVIISGEIEGEPAEVKLSDGSLRVRKKIPIGFTLELAVDAESKRQLIARQDRLLDVASGTEELSNWHVYVESPEQKIYTHDRHGDVGRGFLLKPDRFVHQPPHFDPLALGLMFSGEFRSGDSLEVIAERCSTWAKSIPQTETPNGQLRYSGKTPFGKYHLLVDPNRGNWPVEMAVGSPATIKQELTIEKQKGSWLPKQCSFFQSNTTTKMHFSWHSVNQTLEDHLFKLEHVEEKYDFSTKRKQERKPKKWWTDKVKVSGQS